MFWGMMPNLKGSATDLRRTKDWSRDSRSAGLVALRSWDAFLLVVTCTSAGIVDVLPRHEDPVVCSDGASRLAEKCHV